LTTANTAVIAQYAPNTPKITLKIAVLLIKKATEIAFKFRAFASSRSKPRGCKCFYFIRI
jgi:hypothetical protein